MNVTEAVESIPEQLCPPGCGINAAGNGGGLLGVSLKISAFEPEQQSLC